MEIRIFTDGSCRKNGDGAYGVVVVKGDEIVERIAGAEKDTTNNKMEMSGVIAALQYIVDEKLDKTNKVTIYSDSEYVVKGTNEWLQGWKARHYFTAAGKRVKNQEYWQEIDRLIPLANFQLVWVKGHVSKTEARYTDLHKYNNEVDKLVSGMTDELSKKETQGD